jgi:hypothetical protein
MCLATTRIRGLSTPRIAVGVGRRQETYNGGGSPIVADDEHAGVHWQNFVVALGRHNHPPFPQLLVAGQRLGPTDASPTAARSGKAYTPQLG